MTTRSGSLTAGGTAQTLSPANSLRGDIIIQNPTTAAGQNIAAAEALYIRVGATAGVNNGTSFEIPAGGYITLDFPMHKGQLISVNAATINHRWIAEEALQ